jgi:hypothetical protein
LLSVFSLALLPSVTAYATTDADATVSVNEVLVTPATESVVEPAVTEAAPLLDATIVAESTIAESPSLAVTTDAARESTTPVRNDASKKEDRGPVANDDTRGHEPRDRDHGDKDREHGHKDREHKGKKWHHQHKHWNHDTVCEEDEEVIEPGMGGGEEIDVIVEEEAIELPEIEEVIEEDVVLAATVTEAPASLPATGASSSVSPLLSILAAVSAYGAVAGAIRLQRR